MWHACPPTEHPTAQSIMRILTCQMPILRPWLQDRNSTQRLQAALV